MTGLIYNGNLELVATRSLSFHLYFSFQRPSCAVADPGFPVGGRGPRRGGVDPRGGYITKILYVKTKESGPVGGGRAPGTPP